MKICHSRGLFVKLPRSSRLICVSRATRHWHCRRLLRPTLWVCLRTPTYAPSMPSGLPSCMLNNISSGQFFGIFILGFENLVRVAKRDLKRTTRRQKIARYFTGSIRCKDYPKSCARPSKHRLQRLRFHTAGEDHFSELNN
ncbi:unnamed protein product [Malus baccata var. baccata]